MVRILFFWLCAIFIGCSGGTGTIPDLVDGDPSDSTFITDPGGILLDLTSTPDEVADLPILEVAEDKGTPVDTENSCEPGTGCFGEACQGNGDCVSGICLMHEGDSICSVACIEDCPKGWSCRAIDVGGADLSFACVSNFSHLCQPCLTKEDCSSGDIQNVCLDYGDTGRFCGATCADGGGCPESYTCQDIASVTGGVSAQCVHDSGVCDCGQTSINLALSTECNHTNTLGSCTGLRFCTDSGLSSCDAPEPVEESCNGLDDDCDGGLDEDTCEDNNPCTMDSCEGSEGCQHTPLTGVPCDDGTLCTENNLCQEGLCEGDLVVCEDGLFCTDDSCDPDVGCVFSANVLACDDGNACSLDDQCEEGTCVSGPEIFCDDGNPCTDDSCSDTGCVFASNDGSCSDGNACTLGDHCEDGQCAFSQMENCDDANPCTTEQCDPLEGCVVSNNDLPCTDGDVCTTVDSCSDGACVGGSALNCDDGNPCTDDSCDSLTGCSFVANDQSCDDGNACTPLDVCSKGACQGTGAEDCDDGNPCTTDGCWPEAGCAYSNNDLPCEDGDLCSLNDACVDGTCSPGLVEMSCNDGNPCTDDTCGGPGCIYTPNTAPCDDGNICTGGDLCSSGLCVPGAVIDCDDGQFCNGPEVCDVLTGICDGTAPDLDDGIACTNDSCDEANDVIVNEPDASTCLADGPCEVATCDPAASGCTISLLSDCCGNGVVEGTEECDDGNEVVDDGCDLVCTVNSNVDVTFTTCGASGSSGPSQSACDGSYAGQPDLAGAVSVTSGIQYWTVPASGTYRITVNGAEGGSHTYGVGGSGARLEGDFNLSDGTVLKILVGQRGSNGGAWASAGGGTFVTLTDNTPLIVAAGGGSRGNCNSGPFDSAHGKAATGSGNGGGGSNDGGYCGCGGAGSAGGGFFTDGSPTGSGQAFINGGAGGTGARPGQCIDPGQGGFGGGGNGGNGGGGGGGYEGGHAGGNGPSGNTAGDGGKSFNGGANTSGSDGANSDDGNVHIVRL